jgi:hypothetical protein
MRRSFTDRPLRRHRPIEGLAHSVKDLVLPVGSDLIEHRFAPVGGRRLAEDPGHPARLELALQQLADLEQGVQLGLTCAGDAVLLPGRDRLTGGPEELADFGLVEVENFADPQERHDRSFRAAPLRLDSAPRLDELLEQCPALLPVLGSGFHQRADPREPNAVRSPAKLPTDLSKGVYLGAHRHPLSLEILPQEKRKDNATPYSIRTTDNGATWQPVGPALPRITGGLSVSRSQPQLVRAATATGVQELALVPTCVPDGRTLCFQDGRFRVTVDWEDFEGGSGIGHTVPLEEDTGAFWFFHPDNLELMVKVLDGPAVNSHFWVVLGALSNVAHTVEVTDTETGAVWRHENPAHRLASVASTLAFPAEGFSPGGTE